MNELIKADTIAGKIYLIRNVQVMLDKDIAVLYEVKPTRMREQVQRNIARFPGDFMFQLTESEVDFMVSQNAIPSRKYLGGSLPYVFTEQGVASLSGVLKSQKASEVHVQIMRAFVAMRRFIQNNADMFKRIDSLEIRQLQTEEKVDAVLDAIGSQELEPKQGVFFNGQIFDAYSFASKLIRKAKSSIVLIDNYVDDSVLTMLSKRRKGVTAKIYCKRITKQLRLDLDKHNAQYPTIELLPFDDAHDRFLVLDGVVVYHIGASLKDLGKKWFAFSKIEKDALKVIEQLEK